MTVEKDFLKVLKLTFKVLKQPQIQVYWGYIPWLFVLCTMGGGVRHRTIYKCLLIRITTYANHICKNIRIKQLKQSIVLYK